MTNLRFGRYNSLHYYNNISGAQSFIIAIIDNLFVQFFFIAISMSIMANSMVMFLSNESIPFSIKFALVLLVIL